MVTLSATKSVAAYQIKALVARESLLQRCGEATSTGRGKEPVSVTTNNGKGHRLVPIPIALMIGVSFLLDPITPLGYADGLLYSVALLTAQVGRRGIE
ncbi:MAG: hypothetical protein ACYC6A_03490 [Armatimonadota bacterium]